MVAQRWSFAQLIKQLLRVAVLLFSSTRQQRQLLCNGAATRHRRGREGLSALFFSPRVVRVCFRRPLCAKLQRRQRACSTALLLLLLLLLLYCANVEFVGLGALSLFVLQVRSLHPCGGRQATARHQLPLRIHAAAVGLPRRRS